MATRHSAQGAKLFIAVWRLGDGAVLTLASNLGSESTSCSPLAGRLLFATIAPATQTPGLGLLPGYSTYVFLDTGRADNA